MKLLASVRSGPLIEACREAFWERMAICMVDGNQTEFEAMQVAMRELKSRLGAGEQKELF